MVWLDAGNLHDNLGNYAEKIEPAFQEFNLAVFRKISVNKMKTKKQCVQTEIHVGFNWKRKIIIQNDTERK